jgi:nonsense-mediated mRNA decay protein 3
MQCDDCKKEFTPHTWGAVVQVRQHVDHKKTFYLIEQLILKHGAYDKVLKISNEDDGINFYYKNTTHAQRLVDFLNSILPTSVKHSKQLISHDMNSNTFVYKYGFAV